MHEHVDKAVITCILCEASAYGRAYVQLKGFEQLGGLLPACQPFEKNITELPLQESCVFNKINHRFCLSGMSHDR